MQPFTLVALILLSSFSTASESHFGPADERTISIEMPLSRPDLGLKISATPFPISGLDKDSNAFFSQGIAALHGFWIFEAERNFREVIRRNPTHPMPLAFAAFAQTVFGSGDRARGVEYIKKGQAAMLGRGTQITEAEHLWFDAIVALFDTRVEKEKRSATHISRLKEVLKATEDKNVLRETKAFLALALWGYELEVLKDDLPKQRGLRAEIDSLLEDVLKDSPTHPGHHYKIHLWNNDNHDVLARDSAKTCGKDNPACAHLWHMPSHIFSNVREFKNAAYNFEAAHRVDNKYLSDRGLPSKRREIRL